jgi:cytochrome d ubiquinol oxidase subunit I
VFSDKVGPVLGPLMAYEVLTAFFLEAGFLGVMLFGRERVGPLLHLFSTYMVALGTLMSTFWILSANSWMHTPQGYGVNDAGQFVPVSWLAVIFNPSFPYRLVHMVLAAYLTTAFVVGATGAWHLLRDRGNERAQLMFSMAMWMAGLVAPLQLIAGDLHGTNTLAYQPAKVAAIEGHFETQSHAPLILFGMPDMAAQTTRYALEVPELGSLILTHRFDGTIKGLKSWPRADQPYAPLVFWSFRVMVGIGLLMMGLGIWGLFCRWRGRLYQSPWLLRSAVAMGPAGFVAVLAGWITTEVGRQPYTVYGLLRTADSVSPIGAPGALGSLLAFVVVYSLVFGAGTFYIVRALGKPPAPTEPENPTDTPLRSAGITPVAAVNRGAAAG